MSTGADGLGVALLTPCFWPEVRRGSERFVRELADGLRARGQRPRIVTSHRGLPRTTVEDGVPIARHPRPPAGRLRRRRFEDHLTHLPFAYAELLRGDDDIAHAVYPTDALAAARWSRRTGGPSVLSYMGIPTRRWLTMRRERVEITLRAARDCDAVVALSRAAAAEFERQLGLEVRVIAPGVDLGAFRPGGDRHPKPTVVCAAAIDQPQKRVELLLAAFERLRRERPSARLVLSRPRDPAVGERLVGERPGVELANLDDRQALAEAYRRAWVSALPSRGEAFGLVLVESLACGTPVVGSRLGAIPEIVDRDEIGTLFDGDDPAALAAALDRGLDLAADPATAPACHARAEDFSVDRCVEAYLALYNKLLERG